MQAKQHNLVQDVAARLNSIYFLIERFLEQRCPVTAILSDPSITKYSDHSLDLTSEQWNLLAKLKPVLHVLQVATTFLSAEWPSTITGLDYLTGLMEWTGGMTLKIIFILSNDSHLLVELCGGPAACF